MKFIADEGVDSQIVNKLREHEHHVLYVVEFAAGASDSDLLNFANQNTNNKRQELRGISIQAEENPFGNNPQPAFPT